jgi:hypothetical protein
VELLVERATLVAVDALDESSTVHDTVVPGSGDVLAHDMDDKVAGGAVIVTEADLLTPP